MEFDNELDQKQKEIALLRENEKVKDLTNLLLSLGLIAISIIGFLMFRHQKLKNDKNKELMAQQQELMSSQEELGKTDIYERATAKAKEILETHQPDPLPDSVLAEIRMIIEDAEKELGVNKEK